MSSKLTEKQIKFIEEAVGHLEKPGFLVEMTNQLGRPLESLQKKLPATVTKTISLVTRSTLEASMTVALHTLSEAPSTNSSQNHQWLSAFTGAAGGFLGLPGLVAELPITTMIMLRSIAAIAQENGYDPNDDEVKMQCLQVFALGSDHSNKDDAMETSYYTARFGLAQILKESPLIAKFIAAIATRFEVAVGEKLLAQGVPLFGAIGGATINTLFCSYFNRTAKYHFGLRRLEDQIGAEVVQSEYRKILRQLRQR